MDRVVIATRSLNEELYRLSGELLGLPFPRYRITGTTADSYFCVLHELDADWVINIDEDAFVTAPDRILALLQYMQEHDYDCCGMPDGGVVDIRFHNPLVPNAFFTIHNVKKVREWFNLDEIYRARYERSLDRHVPTNLLRREQFAFDDFEPYYKYFFWLLHKGARFLYLDAIQWVRDPITTILADHERQPFLMHTWYAREYQSQKQRFHQAIAFARAVQQQRERELRTMPKRSINDAL
ncbi:MAG: hypothetical protein KDD69_14645 [Bdellovibrionales bacterium]|nr:hypothetical protein [Bdellovibrionales bacterium]